MALIRRLQRRRAMEARRAISSDEQCCLGLVGKDPARSLAMKDKPLRYSRRLMESRQRPKKPAPSLL
jgi:hypothetical protein